LPKQLLDLGATTYFVPAESTGFPTPKAGIRVVRMLRNMLPLEPAEASGFVLHRYPFTRLRIALLGLAIRRGLPRADRTIFISEYSRSVLSQALTLRDTVLIRHGIDLPAEGSAALGEKIVPERPFVLYVSATFPYKRHLELIEAQELAANRDPALPELVLAGPMLGYYGRQVRRRAARSATSVRVLGEVDAVTARALMRSAEALLFGSTCECCPNVLLEYLAAGRPILSSSAGPMPEIGGDAIAYSDPRRPEVWAEDLLRIVQDRELAAVMAQRASARARQFDLDRVVEDTYRALTIW
jgi:glycosyltransferase involved in cell wall biosynthesis